MNDKEARGMDINDKKFPDRIWVGKEGRIAHTNYQHDIEYIRKDIADKEMERYRDWKEASDDASDDLSKKRLAEIIQPIKGVANQCYTGTAESLAKHLSGAIKETLSLASAVEWSQQKV